MRFERADLCDAKAADSLLKGAAAVLHAAAVPGPSSTPPPGVDAAWSGRAKLGLETLSPGDLLTRNVASAWNVFEAAARAGATRVVFSSSAFAQGWSHNPVDFRPPSLPLDEASAPMPHESYGLSKLLGEQAAACVARSASRTSKPLTVASLRFTNLVYPDAEHTLPWAAPTEPAPANVLMWCWAKAGDVAAAHVAALEADPAGGAFASGPHQAFLLAAPTTRFVEPSGDLVARWYPDAVLARPLVANESLIDAGKARRLLGWRPTTVPALLQQKQ